MTETSDITEADVPGAFTKGLQEAVTVLFAAVMAEVQDRLHMNEEELAEFRRKVFERGGVTMWEALHGAHRQQ
jgi:hypothetical protein